jgi:serine/threonine protein kinase
MSPEQAEGKPVDARSDVFSFGSVLYEMVTGRRAFQGSTRIATLSSILRDEPKPAADVAAEPIPRDLEKIIARCLRKDVARRFQHIDDVKLLLEELKEESESGEMPAGSAKAAHRRWPALTLAFALIIVAAGARLWLNRSQGPEQPSVVPITTFLGSEDYPSFSPDGNQVAFARNGEKQDNWDLYVKMIGNPAALRLTTDAADDESRTTAGRRTVPGVPSRSQF